MTKDEEIDFEFLRRAAERADLYVNIHRNFDPLVDRGGPLYVQTRRKVYAGKMIDPVHIAKFLTFAEAWKLIGSYSEKARA